MTQKRLFIALAHPDDESFGLGALIARYVSEGAQVYYLCATNGDVGTISPELLDGYDSHAALRLAELDCAAQVLGFARVYKLGYRDSGMMGSPDNNNPSCLWHQWRHNPEEVIRRVVEVIREVKPQVVLTFNRYGGYGHPDHIAIQRATTEAFKLAGASDYITDGKHPHSPQKLYFTSIPTMFLRLAILTARLQRRDPRKVGRNHDIDLVAILDHVEPAHAYIDVGKFLDVWDAAAACHRSQGGGRGGIIPRWLRRLLPKKQGFTRIYPAPAGAHVDEDDLFAGVTADELAAPSMS